MPARHFLGQLVVPAIVLVATALFFASIREAPSVTQRVPLGVMVFILAMAVVVVVRAALEVAAQGTPDSGPRTSGVADWSRRGGYIALAIGYALLFQPLGFSLANVVFLVAALALAGFGEGTRPAVRVVRILAVALFATAVFHALALVMNFNVPTGPLGF